MVNPKNPKNPTFSILALIYIDSLYNIFLQFLPVFIFFSFCFCRKYLKKLLDFWKSWPKTYPAGLDHNKCLQNFWKNFWKRLDCNFFLD